VGEGGGRDAGDGVPAHQLAWDFDLVIATFQQLSSQWSRHREGKPNGAPLLQASVYIPGQRCWTPCDKNGGHGPPYNCFDASIGGAHAISRMPFTSCTHVPQITRVIQWRTSSTLIVAGTNVS